MKILKITKQWEEPTERGNNRFEGEYEDDKGEVYYTGFIAVDEAEAYKLFLQSFDRGI
jgi:hypothetical protein